MKRSQSECRPHTRLASAATLVLVMLLLPATVQAGGRCVAANIPAAMVLPDGSSHDAGVVRVCLTRTHSPVAGMHKAYVDGHMIGVFISERTQTEGLSEDGRPYLQFIDNGSGEWHLVGYAVPAGDHMESFRLEQVGAAVRDALRLGAISFDAVQHLVLCRIERRPPRLNLDLYPYLPRAQVATTSARSYMSLLSGVGP